MPRIRTIKPEFWDSPDTARADLRTRLLYIAMWNWADDYGIGDATPVRLIGFAFPNDPIPASDYPRLLADVSDAFGVVFFEHAGRRYFAIPAWDEHQRTEKKAKANDSLLAAAQSAIAARQRHESESPTLCRGSSEEFRGTSGPGTGEQGNRGTGEKDDDSPSEVTHQGPAPEVVAVAKAVAVPDYVETASRPPKRHPSSAAKTLVRQTLGNAGYRRAVIDRLAVQVDKLAAEGQPDTLIRQALTTWDRRPNCDKPEYLPTVLDDTIKASRASPALNGQPRLQGADLKAAQFQALKGQL
ncbi:hypothetical protein BMW24_003570 [Mycobacterium heckeshornense]|uniref:hypothetical protein n=1 Tax=Mycobacterium heckeshornense TaxID=110505 RepID=UPI0008FD0539|nr:hypothetical protein [Mycobacterium heckeshornense]PIJ36754.1 hypothetical protein BMW24_003285 [Mycobacterium heckeshornense]PIJ36805.1 hypothetical protein BMW24_003570 [Mycobacterium heckeshornense]